MKPLPEELPPLNFKLGEFLRGLYSEALYGGLITIYSAILDVFMNCFSFSSTKVCLDIAKLEHRCYDLLRCTSALQLASQQWTYDQLLLSTQEPSDLERVGAIIKQVKQEKELSELNMCLKECFEFSHSFDLRDADNRRTHDPILFQTPETRKLFLLFDLRCDISSIIVSIRRSQTQQFGQSAQRAVVARLLVA